MNIKLKLFLYAILISASSLSFAVDTDGDTLPDDWEIENGRDPLVADYMVSAGGLHTCALDDNGVVCWGNDENGQTDVPDTLSNPTQVETGRYHTCALDDNGAVCWGYNGDGQMDVPDTLSNPTQVSAGIKHTCALDDNGVTCWGRNEAGETDVPDLLIDPDGDGYSNQGGADVFPLDAAEHLDTDSDGIGNNADTDDDNDGVSDTQESIDGTNPLVADTDGDGLTDGLETSNGTNPLVADTDGDGYSDLDEVNSNSDPLDANSIPLKGLPIWLLKAAKDKMEQDSTN